MDNSMNLTPRDLSCNVRETYSNEESSWTMYFEDFLADNQENSSISSGYESLSLVSDAASSAVKKSGSKQVVDLRLNRRGKQFSSKRRKMVDNSELEDTASSPVSSPKVFASKELERNPGNTHVREICPQNGKAPVQIDYDDNGLGCGRGSDCTELKKKGLCLVPLSMVENHFD